MEVSISIDSFLFDEIFAKIFYFLTTKEILIAIKTSKRWKLVCDTYDEIWIHHIEKLWENVLFNVPRTLSLKDRIATLSLKELKAILKHVDTRGCVEKSDFQKLVAPHLLFGYNSAIVQNRGRLLKGYPLWTQTIPNGKASYYYAKIERARQWITYHELVSIDWEFSFNEYAEEVFTGKFYDDFKLKTSAYEELMSWKFVLGPQNTRMVQVERFPPHWCIKEPDGSWTIQNIAVTFRQKISLTPDELVLVGERSDYD